MAKVEKDVEWIKALLALGTALKTFVLDSADKILEWTGKDEASGAQAYFESLTSTDKLDGFASVPGGAAGASSAPASGGASGSSAPAGNADAIAAEFMSAVQGPLSDLKAKAAALENNSVTQVSASVEEAMNATGALIKAMATYKKPANLDFCGNGSKFATMAEEADSLFKKDRKCPANVMKVAQAGA